MQTSIESTDQELFIAFCLSGKFPDVALSSGGVLPIYHNWLDSIGLATCHTTSKRLSSVMRASPFIATIKHNCTDNKVTDDTGIVYNRLRYRLHNKAVRAMIDAI